MKINKIMSIKVFIRFLILFCFIAFSTFLHAENPATVSYSQLGSDKIWLLENETLRAQLVFSSTGEMQINELYNKPVAKNYLTGNGLSSLFHYQGHFVYAADTITRMSVSIPFDFNANDPDWKLGQYTVEDIIMHTLTSNVVVGQKLIIPVSKNKIQIRLVFEIYNGKAGLRCQNFIKNLTPDYKLFIEQSEVIRFNFPNASHNLHYATNSKWYSTTGSVQEATLNSQGKNVAKLLLNLYDTNDGWYIAPEVNWKTQHGPEIPNSSYEYMFRSFAGATAWGTGSTDYVQVSTNPESLQLVLFPLEEFEYIPVNITVFKGDIIDGKMAVEEHLRKRYKYNNVRSLFDTNDWDWFTQGNRTETFYRNVVVPQAQKAGIDMLMFDDGWNDADASGTGLDNSGTSRDKTDASTTITNNMAAFTNFVVSQGFEFGLWYSMSGGYHNMGFDLASPAVIAAKEQKVEYLINNYHMTHQMVDLTEYWQTCDESPFSHPSDNVYRRNVLTRNMMNDLVTKHPQYVVKVTSELDVFPTQGDRGVELGHIVDNGWQTSIGDGTGGGGGLGLAAWTFGHLPMNSIYFGGTTTGKLEDYYSLMIARNIKFGVQPDQWSPVGVTRLGQFNKWRKSPRISDICEEITRPVYLGANWDSKLASDWAFGQGPFLWMYVTRDQSRAMLIGTSNEQVGTIGDMNVKLRWLDATKTYLVQDITLDDTGVFTYLFLGKITGADLVQNGFLINMYQNTSRGKAFWIQEYKNVEKQVVYADDDVTSYTETLNGSTLTIEATGKPNTTGKIIVYGKTEDKSMIQVISFDSNGNGQVSLSTIVSQPVTIFPYFTGSISYEMENYNSTATLSRSDIVISIVNNGNPDPTGGKSAFVGMKNVGDYIIYNLEIPVAATYDVSVKYKLSISSRGTSQWSIVENGTETTMGLPYLQSATVESMKIIDLGQFKFNTPGVKQFKMKLVAGTTTGVNLSTDNITLTIIK